MEGSTQECYNIFNLTSDCQNSLNSEYWTTSLQVLSGISIASAPISVTVTEQYSVDSNTRVY